MKNKFLPKLILFYLPIAIYFGLSLFPQTWEIIKSCFALSKYDFKIFQLITYAFLHGSIEHIISNALILYVILDDVLDRYGSKFIMWSYFVSSIISGIAFLCFERGASVIGSSGALMCLWAIYALTFPNKSSFSINVDLFSTKLNFKIEALMLYLIVLAYEILRTFIYYEGHTSTIVHIAGALTGFGIYKLYKSKGYFWPL